MFFTTEWVLANHRQSWRASQEKAHHAGACYNRPLTPRFSLLWQVEARMAENEKKQALSQKRKAHRATPCDSCGHPLASHHALGKCKNANCRCTRFVSELKRKSRAQGQNARR